MVELFKPHFFVVFLVKNCPLLGASEVLCAVDCLNAVVSLLFRLAMLVLLLATLPRAKCELDRFDVSTVLTLLMPGLLTFGLAVFSLLVFAVEPFLDMD